MEPGAEPSGQNERGAERRTRCDKWVWCETRQEPDTQGKRDDGLIGRAPPGWRHTFLRERSSRAS
jgi:hypothetical protein